MRFLRSFLRDERGATAVEYGLIVAVLSLAMIAGFGQFTGALNDMFGFIGTKIDNPSP
ncbi:Flp family type IVb pilin [Rhizobium terrae]|uniref:Flp family type IVb pilin n=1 Tax=Rhizobium terrae TaxID=2171756 RepID=UPI000E3E9D61|nr:Flp family type IVb pilin [Rhizobium terrae]